MGHQYTALGLIAVLLASAPGAVSAQDAGVVQRLVQSAGLSPGHAQALARQVSAAMAANADAGGNHYDRVRQAIGLRLFGGPGGTPAEYSRRHSRVLLTLYHGLDEAALQDLFGAGYQLGACRADFGLTGAECAALHAAATGRAAAAAPAAAAPGADVLAQARAAFARGDYAGAVRLYRQAAQQDPTNAVAFAGVGRASLRLGDAASAVVAYQTAVGIAPNVPALQEALEKARAALAGGQSHAAPRARGKAAAGPALSPAAQQRRLGQKHFEEGRYMFAASAFEKAAAIEPGHVETYRRIAECYRRINQQGRAAAALEELVKLTPENVGHRLDLVEALIATGRLADANEHVKEALALQAGNSRAKRLAAQLKKRAPKRAKKVPPKAVAAAPAPKPAEAPEEAPPQGDAKPPEGAPEKVAAAEGDAAKGKDGATAEGEKKPDAPRQGGEAAPKQDGAAAEGDKKPKAKDDLMADLLSDPMGSGE